MKRLLTIAFLIQLTLFGNAQYQVNTNKKGIDYYVNPIFAGDYPDPSILRDGDDYYFVNTSCEYYPGLLIWHSKDLISWTPVTSALHKYVGSVWAPDFVKYKNKYYIYFPAEGKVYVVTANSIDGPWSDPVDLKLGGIDPGHVADTNGKRYLYIAGGGYVPLSDDGLSVIGELKHVYDDWTIPGEWTIECSCQESPKLAKRGDYYYLTVAQGGTAGPATSHMVVSARSKSPFGPWENSPYNPVIHTRSDAEKWWSKGHGTLFEDAKGKWWIVFHAYEKGYYNMGRQTLLLPVEWTKDGWYKIPDGIKDDEPIKRPNLVAYNTNFTLSDSLNGNDLKPQWKFFGEYDPGRFKCFDNGLIIKAKGNTVSNCSPLICIPSDHSYTAEAELFIEGKATGGIVLFYNNNAHTGILADPANILQDFKGGQFVTAGNILKNHAFLRIKNVNSNIDMFYSTDGVKWNKLEQSPEVSGMHHNMLDGFLSLRLGICAMGEGSVRFKNFLYKPIK
jgi:xylan 1,4-beta-xylosidase